MVTRRDVFRALGAWFVRVQVDGTDVPTATLTGGVVTDALRLSGAEDDGHASPDSSVGIWQARENLCPNPNATTNKTGWSNTGTAGSLARVTSGWAAFGTTAFEVVPSFSGSNNEAWIDCPIDDPTLPYTASVILYAAPGAGAIGKTASIVFAEVGGAVATANMATGSVTIVEGENRIRVTGTPAQADRTHVRPRIRVTPAVLGDTVRFGGLMVVQAPYAVPYAETTASAGRIQLPASLLSPRQGWVALRTRMEMDPLDVPDGGITLFRSEGGELSLTWDDGVFAFTRTDGVATETATARGTWVDRDEVTVAARWTPEGCAVSVGGAPFLTGELVELSDDFERVDTDLGLGTAPTGQTWRQDGQVPGRIVSGRYLRPMPANQTCYEQISLSDRPIQQHCQASFDGTYGPFSAVVMICAAEDAPFAAGQTYLNGMVHPVFAVYQMNVSIYENNTHEGILSLNWPDIAGVTVEDTDPASDTFGFFLLKTDGTVYDFFVEIDWTTNTITLRALQGDTVLGEVSATDARVSQFGGRHTVWQSYFNQSTVPTADVIARFESVDATVAVYDPVAAVLPDGALTTIDIGSNAGTNGHLNGEVLWVAAGRGYVSDDDLATVQELTDTDPPLASFSFGLPTIVWPANDATLTAGNQDAYSFSRARRVADLRSPSVINRLQAAVEELAPSTSFKRVTAGQRIQSTHINDLQSAVEAMSGRSLTRVASGQEMAIQHINDIQAVIEDLTN